MWDGLLRRLWPLSRLTAAWQHDLDVGTKALRKELRLLRAHVDRLEAELAVTAVSADRGERLAEQIRFTLLSDRQDQEWLHRLPALLDRERIRQHVECAIDRAPLRTDPLEHVVVERLLPDDVYELVLKARPPAPFFENRDPVKRDIRMPISFGPALMTQVWRFFDEFVAHEVIRPAVLRKFSEGLRAHLDELFGAERREQVLALPPSTASGRLALRRPGYRLAPHRDPKHSLLTCLVYLAAPGEPEEFGTNLYRVEHDQPAPYKQTYFPEPEGSQCEVAERVPFRPNSMLVFLNSRGAHGAEIPDGAPAVDRYTYQFYVAPAIEPLRDVLRSLPRELRLSWRDKGRVR